VLTVALAVAAWILVSVVAGVLIASIARKRRQREQLLREHYARQAGVPPAAGGDGDRVAPYGDSFVTGARGTRRPEL
jgi:hypothetical protein